MMNKAEDIIGNVLVFIVGALLLGAIVFVITLIVRFFCEMFFNPYGFLHPEDNSNVGYWIFGILLYIVFGLIIISPIGTTHVHQIRNSPCKKQSYDTSYFVDPDFDYNGDYGMDE